jgi:hypothetical protein
VATIQQLRELFGGQSDAETIKTASERLGLDPVEIADELGFGSSGGKNKQRMSASVDNYQAGLYGTAEAVSGAVGLSGASDWARRQRESNEIEAQIAGERARRLGAVDAWRDVHSVGDFGDYAAGLGIQSLPYMGEAVVGGMTGGLTAARFGLTGAKAINAARGAGAAVASYPSSVGDILQNQREQGGETDLLSAAALGVPYAAANVVGVEGSLARGQLFRNSVGALDNISGVRGGLARAGVTAGRTAASEAGSEVFQEGMNQFGRMAVDPSETFFNERSNERFMESAIGGATLGGIMGGGAGGWRRSQTYTTNTAPLLPDAAPVETAYIPQDSLTNTPVTGLPGFASQPQDPLQGMLQPSVNINPNAAMAPAASGNVAANPPSNSQTSVQAKQPEVAPVTLEERQAANEKYRTESVLDDGTEEGHWRVFGKDFFKRSDLNKALDKQAVEDRGRDPGLSSFEKELNAAGPAFPRAAKLQELAGSLYAPTPEKTAYNLDAAIKGGHKEADRLAAVYEKITGKESPAWKAAQEPKPSKPAAKKEEKPQPTPAAQPKVEAPVQQFEEDDVEGMARATLMKLFNGNEANVEIALADLRGEKPAKIQEDFGVSDSQVRKIRGRIAPKALEIAARQAGVPLEKLQAALARKDAIKEVAGEELVTEEAPTREVMDSDERPLATATDEELTAEQQESDTYATVGMSVREGSGAQVADASTRNNSRAKLEAANGKVSSKTLTPADLNNLWLEATEKDDRKLALDIENEILLRHKRGELSMADMEALGEAQDEAAVLPARQEDADATRKAAAPAATRQANAKKVPKGPVGTAWDKVVRQVAKAKVEVPAWDTLTPEQKIKAQDKYALNGKITLHEVQAVVGSTTPVVQKATQAQAAAPAPTTPKIDAKSAATVGKLQRSKLPSIKEATGKDFMARLNEAAAQKKQLRFQADDMVDNSFMDRRRDQLRDEERKKVEAENEYVRQFNAERRREEQAEYETYASEVFAPWWKRVSPLADKLEKIHKTAGWYPDVPGSQASGEGAILRLEEARKYVKQIAESTGDEKFSDPGFFAGVNLRHFMENSAADVEQELKTYLNDLQRYLHETRHRAYSRELKKQLDPILNNVTALGKRRLVDVIRDKIVGQGAPKGWGRIEGNDRPEVFGRDDFKPEKRLYAEVELVQYNGKQYVYSHVVDAPAFLEAHRSTRLTNMILVGEEIDHLWAGFDHVSIAEADKTRVGSLANYNRYADGARGLEIAATQLDAPNGAFVIMHELGHAADMISVNYPSDKPGVFSSDIGWAMLPNGNDFMPVGPYATELHRLWTSNEEWSFLRYPLNRLRYPNNINGARRELFAQVFAAYMINPDLVEKDAPLTARFMEKALEQIRQTDYAAELAKAKAGAKANNPEQGSAGHAVRDRFAAERIETAEGAPEGTGRQAQGGRSRSAQASRQAERFIAALPQASRSSGKRLWTTIADAAKKGFYGAAFTWDLADIAAKQLPSVTKYMDLMNKKAAVKTHLEDQVEKILASTERVAKTDRLGRAQTGTGEHSINKFLYDSTIAGKWGYKDDPASGIQVDPALAERFNNFTDDAKAVIRQVFKHGADTLRQKQRIIKDEINNEFRQLAKDAGQEPEKVAELERKRRAALQHYDSILFLTANKPYAPLRRFGNYVVIARSQAFRDAMANSNNSAIERMQSDENHYFVAFYETLGEAEEHADRLRGTGRYAETSAFEKEKGLDAIYGGRDMMTAFQRLRNLIKTELEEDPSDQVMKSLNGMISDLYLQTLAETSARKAEIKRRNVAGADLDMLRAFATQGRADAHFIAALKHNGDVTDSMYEMRREAHDAAGDKAAKMRLFNEFMARHALHMNYTETRVQDAIMRGTSLWMLATSPAYYLQNATQTPMISVPYMAGKHGYGRSWSAITQAYKDLGPMSEGLQFSDRMDFSKAPADVRRMISDLVAGGRIDIALDQDLGRFQSRADSALGHTWNLVDRKLRGMQQRVEAINRVTTAIAAYRMELARNGGNHAAATEYASKVIRVTHGDYSAFNSPRYFTPGGGLPAAKVITQFRKFQIIQASLIVRLFNNAFTGEASSEERAIARKALFFTLGHTAAVGGMYGLPGASTLAWLVAKLLGDPDEPDNDEVKLRRLIGNEDLADLVLKGAPAYFGVDLSGKLGMGNAFSVMPYANITGMNRDSFEKGLLALTGPFVGGLLPRFADGVEQIGRGNWYRGLEQMVPSGFANAMRAYRFQDEGVTKRNGDVNLDADEITFATTLLQSLGLQTKQLTDEAFDRRVQTEFEQFYKDKSSRLTEKYARAAKKGDTEEMAKLREEWLELQEARVRNGFPRQPLSALLKAPVAQSKRERQGGMKNTRRLAEELDEI